MTNYCFPVLKAFRLLRRFLDLDHAIRPRRGNVLRRAVGPVHAQPLDLVRLAESECQRALHLRQIASRRHDLLLLRDTVRRDLDPRADRIAIDFACALETYTQPMMSG